MTAASGRVWRRWATRLAGVGLPLLLAAAMASAANPVPSPVATLAPASAPLVPSEAPPASPAHYISLPGGSMRTVLPPDGKTARADIAGFSMRSHLVSNAEFREFLWQNPNWQRGQVPAVFADDSYLANWSTPLTFAPLAPDAAVTQVSWFAAAAFCASEGARLPRWAEWEYAAAADETRADARGDALWLARILAWYARPASQPPGRVGQSPPNWYGLYDVHHLVWEWVEDFNGLFVSADSRQGGQARQLDYCGGAALSLADKENYAVLMRLALLGAMEGRRGGHYLGFRCVRELQ